MKKHSSGDIGVVQADTNSLHGGQMYAQLAKPSGRGSSSRGRSQSQADMLLQVPMTTTASHRWLEDAITEWQVRPPGLGRSEYLLTLLRRRGAVV